MSNVVASLNRVKISPRKILPSIAILKKMKVESALYELKFRKDKASFLLLKLLKSLIANAEHNKNINPSSLSIDRINVGYASALKRMSPRARGRGSIIKHRHANITIFAKVDS